MSRAATIANTAGSIASTLSTKAESDAAKAAMVTIQTKIGDAIRTLGFIPPAMQGAIRSRFYDLLSHHRLHTMKYHQLPGGRSAQKWLVTRLYRWTKLTGGGVMPMNVVGEGFAADVDEWGGQLKVMEQGGTRTTQAPMLVPIGAGDAAGPGLKPSKRLQRVLAEKSGAFITTGKGTTFLIEHMAGKRNGMGARSMLLAVLTRRQKYRPMLGYQKAFDLVLPKHISKVGDDVDKAMTVAGRQSLENRSEIEAVVNRARIDAMRKYLEIYPGNFREAERVAKLAAKSIRTEYVRTRNAAEGTA